MNKYINNITIRFVGDSGDGIQTIGNQLTNTSIIISKKYIHTFIEYPAEIKTPFNSTSDLSSYNICISNLNNKFLINKVDILTIFNATKLHNLNYLKKNGILIIDTSKLKNKHLILKYSKYKIIKINITNIIYNFTKSHISSIKKTKNFFILGLIYWICNKNIILTINLIKQKFIKQIAYLNIKSLLHGYYFYNNIFFFKNKYIIHKQKQNKIIKKISGCKALIIGCIYFSIFNNIILFSSNYPITPSSVIYYESIKFNNFLFINLQLEDEISVISSSIGASFSGGISFIYTSGPGLDLMQECIGLSIMTEIPILIINIQRIGPSTGIPTKSEQSDLFSCAYGRHGDNFIPVISPNNSIDCFWTIIESFYISIKYMTPIIILLDTYILNNSELWNINYHKFKYYKFFNIINKLINNNIIKIFSNYENINCIGGIERNKKNRSISYNIDNHFKMTLYRFNKINYILNDIYNINIIGNKTGDILIISFGGILNFIKFFYTLNKKILKNISILHYKYINIYSHKIYKILNSFKKIIIIEENIGQLSNIIKFTYNIKTINMFKFNTNFSFFKLLKKYILKYI